MQTFEITSVIRIEAVDKDDAEDFLRDLYDSDPAITEYTINGNHPERGSTAV